MYTGVVTFQVIFGKSWNMLSLRSPFDGAPMERLRMDRIVFYMSIHGRYTPIVSQLGYRGCSGKWIQKFFLQQQCLYLYLEKQSQK